MSLLNVGEVILWSDRPNIHLVRRDPVFTERADDLLRLLTTRLDEVVQLSHTPRVQMLFELDPPVNSHVEAPLACLAGSCSVEADVDLSTCVVVNA